MDSAVIDRIGKAVQRQRLLDTATRLIRVPSPTGDAGAVCEELARLLKEDGFTVERPAGGHPKAPAVVLPEPLSDRLPLVGRGAATWKVTFARQGPPVHEVMRPPDEPNVIAAGAAFVSRLGELGERFCALRDPLAGSETVFVGQIHS